MADAAKNLRQTLHEMDLDGVLVADGFDEAFLGVAERCGQPTIAIYSAEKCVEILARDGGMDYDEAMEYYLFNVVGAWVGPGTPAFLEKVVEETDGRQAEAVKQKRSRRKDGLPAMARGHWKPRVRRGKG